jgi:polysaccharide export outer membrane protein
MISRFLGSALRASLVLVGLTACASGNHGPFVWVNDYAPAKVAATGYMIGVGDALNIQVYGDANKDLATKESVRPDGKISMPLLGEITVVDKSPATVAQEIERSLKDRNLVVDPRVSVHVDAIRPLSISVLGKVAHPGAFLVEAGSGVAQAIASAGGLTEFAKKDQIYLTRTTPATHLRFTFDQITGQGGVASQFKLKSGDVIVVY